MRVFPIGFLIAILCLGCVPAIQSQQDDADSGQQKQGNAYTHVIAVDTEYYTTGPQQSRPPDGKLPAGTRVSIVEEAGSYVLVQSEGGVKAFVATDVVKKQENTAMDISAIVDGSNKFALDLFQKLRAEEGNLFFSPSSISTALAMTYAGSAGETENEMAKTLHFQMPKDQLHDSMHALQAVWNSPDKKKGIRLNLANRLWGQVSYKFLAEFLGITRERYGAELAQMNFAQSEQARQTINRWVEEQTENKIMDLIPAGAIDSDTKLVLTNAVYFHGIWSKPFKKHLTKDEDFHLTSSQKIKVPLMHRFAEYRYGEADNLQILELPYGDGSLSMLVLLPEKGDGLADVEAKLTFQNLQQWVGSLSKRDVKVYVPKFKTTSQFELGDTLKALGMNTAFDPNTADFSGMTGGRDLFISAVIHKAFVDVNEEGTEAAAATGIILAPTSAAPDPTEPPVFRADHPFVFMIRDNRNGTILFMGRIENPLE